MTPTRKTPARLSPDEGRRHITPMCSQPISSLSDGQSSSLRHSSNFANSSSLIAFAQDVERQILHGEDPSGASAEVLRLALSEMWCRKKTGEPQLRFLALRDSKSREPQEYWVENGGRLKRLGKISALTSQARFRKTLVKATAHHSLVWIPIYASNLWDNVVRCLLKVIERPEEGSHV